MNLADITVGFEEIITIVLTVAWFVRLEAKTNSIFTENVSLRDRLTDKDKGNEILLQRIASLEAKIDLLLKDK
jgi:hypothetical protein